MNSASEHEQPQLSPTWNPRHTRSFGGQIVTLLLQPGVFFRTLPALDETRQWVWMMFAVLGLVAFSAVRAETLKKEAAPADSPVGDMGSFDMGSEDLSGGDPIFGGLPPDAALPATSTTADNDVSARWETGVTSASNILLIWFALVLLLTPVSLINGVAPRLDQNFHIVVWASVPMALMAGLQLIYYWAGGKVGEPGLTGILTEWDTYNNLPKAQQTLVYSAAMRLTLFGLWSCVLAYVGAHYALRGKRIVAAFCVLVWVTLIIVVPVLLDSVNVPETTTSEVTTSSPETPASDVIDQGLLPPTK
jgi:hypothetical protein